MYKLIFVIIGFLLCNCSVSVRDNYYANEIVFNSLIKNEINLLDEKYASNELLCFFSLSPNYIINLINQPEKLFQQRSKGGKCGTQGGLSGTTRNS